MNRENVQKLRDAIANGLFYEDTPVKMDMGVIFEKNHCGTTACIAGHANILAAQEGFEVNASDFSSTPAKKWLDIDSGTADVLFYTWPRGMSGKPHEIQKQFAISRLDELLERGYLTDFGAISG